MTDEEMLVSLAVPALGALIALIILTFALRAIRRPRLLQNLPTSKTTGVFIGLVFAVLSFIVRSYMLGHLPEYDFTLWIYAGTGYLPVWLLGWVLMVFNSLVQLRQRVKQAWANIDVLLKLRADLIPKLVNITIGLRDYEKNLQAELAQLRAQTMATQPGLAGPDPQACAGQLLVIAERYPELKANELSTNLQKNLTDTENRISLARGYFNDIATFYNTRLDVIPDRFIAALGAMKPQPLMEEDHFDCGNCKLTSSR